MKGLLVSIPDDVFEKGAKEISNYVENVMKPYNEDTECDPVVIMTNNELMREYKDDKEEYPDINEYCMKFHGGYLNDEGNLVTNINQHAFWESYEIGDPILDNCVEIEKFDEKLDKNNIKLFLNENKEIISIASSEKITEILCNQKSKRVLYLEYV